MLKQRESTVTNRDIHERTQSHFDSDIQHLSSISVVPPFYKCFVRLRETILVPARETYREREMATEDSKKEVLNKGPWSPEEDLLLIRHVETHGEGKWATISKRSSLLRGGKSCRLRWKNYLRPNLKHGRMSEEEEDLIIRLHRLLGNRWSLIAGRLPGRTDNEVKNYWNTRLLKKMAGIAKKSVVPTEAKKKQQQQPCSRDSHGENHQAIRGSREEEPEISGENAGKGVEDNTMNMFPYDVMLHEEPLVSFLDPFDFGDGSTSLTESLLFFPDEMFPDGVLSGLQQQMRL
ncbi:uncharacterized protein LOC143878271 [Tasmannia lanceolata]|uniref:uncharacterized protein LOC143878271 n=1 Tax=Tasmannia lanceolata TaxID=3420 RepID=UPI0040644134